MRSRAVKDGEGLAIEQADDAALDNPAGRKGRVGKEACEHRTRVVSHREQLPSTMGRGYFTSWRDALDRACRTCRFSIGTSDGWRLWCERHRLVVVSACGWWEREAGSDSVAIDGGDYGPPAT